MYDELFLKLTELVDNQLNKVTSYTKSMFFTKCIKIINKQLNINLDEFKNTKDFSNINTILITHINGIGDAILLSPFLRELRKNYPEARIILITYKNQMDIFTYCPYIDDLFIMEQPFVCSQHDAFIYVLDFMRKNFWNKITIDLALVPHASENNYTALITSLFSLAKYRVGYSDNNWACYYDVNEVEKENIFKDVADNYIYGEVILTNHVIYPFDCYHEISRRLYILTYLNCIVEDDSLECWLKDDEKNEMNLFMNKYKDRKKIVIGIGGVLTYKKFLLNKYISLMKKINQYNRNVMFFIACGKSEIDNAKKIKSQINNTVILDFSLRKTIAAMYHMDFYIGNDTAAAHMASLNKKIKMIVIFNEAEEMWNYYPHATSVIRRFSPQCDKLAIIRPKIAADNDILIKIDDIFSLYKKMDESNVNQRNVYTSE